MKQQPLKKLNIDNETQHLNGTKQQCHLLVTLNNNIYAQKNFPDTVIRKKNFHYFISVYF